MARCSEHHLTLTNGVGKCSVPMWMGGAPGGFCDQPAFGFRMEPVTLDPAAAPRQHARPIPEAGAKALILFNAKAGGVSGAEAAAEPAGI